MINDGKFTWRGRGWSNIGAIRFDGLWVGLGVFGSTPALVPVGLGGGGFGHIGIGFHRLVASFSLLWTVFLKAQQLNFQKQKEKGSNWAKNLASDFLRLSFAFCDKVMVSPVSSLRFFSGLLSFFSVSDPSRSLMEPLRDELREDFLMSTSESEVSDWLYRRLPKTLP